MIIHHTIYSSYTLTFTNTWIPFKFFYDFLHALYFFCILPPNSWSRETFSSWRINATKNSGTSIHTKLLLCFLIIQYMLDTCSNNNNIYKHLSLSQNGHRNTNFPFSITSLYNINIICVHFTIFTHKCVIILPSFSLTIKNNN